MQARLGIGYTLQAAGNEGFRWPRMGFFSFRGSGVKALSCVGLCCREEPCKAGVCVHLWGKPVEPASHPFHVSHRTGAGELAGDMQGCGWGLRTQRTQSCTVYYCLARTAKVDWDEPFLLRELSQFSWRFWVGSGQRQVG